MKEAQLKPADLWTKAGYQVSCKKNLHRAEAEMSLTTVRETSL